MEFVAEQHIWNLHSSMERLKAREKSCRRAPDGDLHSSMERLKEICDTGIVPAWLHLHSSMERLKAHRVGRRGLQYVDLHSSMERLKA